MICPVCKIEQERIVSLSGHVIRWHCALCQVSFMELLDVPDANDMMVIGKTIQEVIDAEKVKWGL